MRLSLCMIVRNEAENIADCIRSVKPVVDEIIVVDTGSADDTRKIAEELGAKVFEFPWSDNFAAARNESLRHATGDYILWLDADDRISHEDRKGLKFLKDRLPSSGNPACMLRILNQKADGETAVSYQLRIFPNVEGACFEGCVHEQIAPSLNRLGIKIQKEDIHIIHTGYRDEETIRGRAARNLRILLNSTQDRDRTPLEYYHLAQSYFGIRDYRRSMECLEMAMAAGRKESFYKHLFPMAADCCLRSGNGDLAIKNLRQGIAEFPESGFLHYVLGAVLTQLERHVEAVPCLERAAELGIEIEGYPVLLNVESLLPYYYGRSLEGTGRLEEAVDAYEKALKAAPGNVDTLRALGFLMSRLGKFEKAMDFFEKAKESSPCVKRGIWLALAKIYLFFEKNEGAIDLYSELLKEDPEDSDALSGLKKIGIPTLSLCMIVRNEEKCLPRCLESVKSIVDEMVIVDTGSTDRTVEIAKSFGAKVIHHPWNDDFAEARNVSLRHATSDWILVLDADEVIAKRDLSKLRNACRPGKFMAYSIVTRNYNNDSKGATWVPNDGQCEEAKEFTGWSPSRKVRLFRNNSAIRFDGTIHELVEPSIRRAGWKIGFCDAPVHHLGRARPEKEQEAKGRAYFVLGSRKMVEENQDPGAYFERGVQGASLGYHEQAVRDFYRVKELAPSFPRIDSNLSASLIHLERYDEAIGVLEDGIQREPGDAGLRNNLGLAYYVRGIYGSAIENLEKAVRLKPDYAAAYKNLGMAYAQAGRIKDAISVFTKAFKLNPALVEIKKTLEKLKEMDDSNFRSPASGLLPPAPPTLSLCMIVKNEEENLPQCLESVKSIVDEIVIVDTGSTDRTVEIAESFGAKVFYHPWNNDFAEARNVSLKHATCGWILVLDADEVVAKCDLPRIRSLLNSRRNVWAYKLTLRNYELTSGIRGNTLNSGDYEEGRGFPAYGAVDLIRLFRNRPDISFKGRVHELVTPSAMIQKEGLAVASTGIPVHHYGKVLDHEKVIRKAQIYRKIGEKKILDNPKDVKTMEDLGAQYIELGDIDSAEKILKPAMQIDPNRFSLWFNLGVVYVKKGQWVEALESFVKAIELNPKDADSRYNCGLVLEKIEQIDAAIEQHSEAIALNPDHVGAKANLQRLSSATFY